MANSTWVFEPGERAITVSLDGVITVWIVNVAGQWIKDG